MKLLLWDIDGTLLLFRGAGRRAAVRAFARAFEMPDVEALTRDVVFSGSTDPRILREMAQACGVSAAAFEARRADLRKAYLEEIRREVSIYSADPVLPGVRSVLETLAGRTDVRQALLTGNYEPGARIKLEPYGLSGFFPVGGFGDDSEDRREVAAVARTRSAAHHRIDPPAGDVVVIGDTVHDVDCARAHGFRAVALCTGRFDRGTLSAAGAHLVLDDLTGEGVIEELLE